MALTTELLPADLTARLDRLDVRSRKLLRGLLPGERRSKRRGQSVEFADYRPYVMGDDLRFIDWNLYARLDRLFLRVFLEEEDLSVSVVIDRSASMRYGDPSKLVFAARAAAALGYITLTHQNRLSVFSIGGEGGMERVSGLRGHRSLPRLIEFLEPLAEERPERLSEPLASDLAGALRLLAATHRTPGVLVVISDFLEKGEVADTLRYIAHPRWDTLAIQVLSPEELDPTAHGIAGDLRLRDAEDGAMAEVSITPGLLRRYQERLAGFRESVRSACLARDVAYLFARSSEPVGRVLLDPLRRQGILG
ncbi:MAG: DUF58 domain-containing protein [Phycisphaeraceae bacterium]